MNDIRHKLTKTLKRSWKRHRETTGTDLKTSADSFDTKMKEMGAKFSAFPRNRPKGYVSVTHPADLQFGTGLFGYVFVPEDLALKMVVLDNA